MKKFSLVLVSVFFYSLVAYSQVPQSVCYQGVATDQSGRELVSQNIKVRISILKNASNGSEEWVETHNVTTDGFGLFDLQIGNGTRIGGAQTTFRNIKWGLDKYYLKVEMDITGNNNFVLMGTNQMVSVPYALYSERSFSAFLADSSSRAGRATIATTAETATYATKAGVADSASKAGQANTALSATYADSARRSQTAITAQTALKADQATFAWSADSARRAGQAQRAILADSSLRAQVAWNAVSANRAIAADSSVKAGYAWLASKADTALVAKSALDDLDKDPKNEIQSLIYRNDTLILSNPAGSAYKVNMSSAPFRAPGATIEYPQGILGESLVITTNYTVPNGKSLFVSAVNSTVILGDGRRLYAEPGMPIIPSGYVVSSCYCTGILVPEQPEIKTIILDFTSQTFEYTVPAGHTLVIKSGKTERGLLDLQLDNDIFNFYTVTSQSPRLIVINAGKKVKKPVTIVPSDSLVLTGYLIKN